MIKYFIKFSFIRKLITSLGVRLLKLLKINEGCFNIDGLKMYLNFLDPIDRIIILNKTYETEELNILSRVIENHSIKKFIDIGANCGFYSFKFAKKKLNVLAFEPNSDAFQKMKNTINKNFYLNNYVKIFPFGISDTNSNLKMVSMIKHGYVQTGGSGVLGKRNFDNSKFKIYDANFKIGDEVLTFKNEKIAIKIDVEGHELNVLKSITNLLKYNNCVIQIEIFDENFDKINNYLLKNNYKQFDQYKKRYNFFYSNF